MGNRVDKVSVPKVCNIECKDLTLKEFIVKIPAWNNSM